MKRGKKQVIFPRRVLKKCQLRLTELGEVPGDKKRETN